MSKAPSRGAQIRQLCTRIAREFKPEKIILFGSHAYGQHLTTLNMYSVTVRYPGSSATRGNAANALQDSREVRRIVR